MTATPFPPISEETVFTLHPAGRADEFVFRLASRFRIQVREPVEQRELFIDTHDWRLHRSRMTLARRDTAGRATGRSGEFHLTAAEGAATRSPARGKLDFAWELPEGPLREAVRRVTAVRRLVPQVETRVRVTAVEVLDGREKTVVRVQVVEGHAQAPGEDERALPTTVRVESLRGYDGERAELVEFLRDDAQLTPSDSSGLALAMRAVGRDPDRQALTWLVELAPAAPAGLEVRRVLQRFQQIMRANEAGMLADVDTEFLHDFRVAVRRTRSILSNCKQVLARDGLAHFKGEFSWLGESTSRVRDLDVFLLAAHGRDGDLGGSDPADLGPLQRRLAGERRAAWRHMVEALRSARYHYAMEAWSAFLERPSDSDPEGAHAPMVAFAGKRIARQHERVLRHGAHVDADSSDAKLHALRIQCKKLRYLVDAFGGLFAAQPVTRLVKQLKRLQEALGNYNDAGVQRDMLYGFASELEGAPPATLLSIGRAIERLAHRADELRPEILERVDAFNRKQGHDVVAELTRGARD